MLTRESFNAESQQMAKTTSDTLIVVLCGPNFHLLHSKTSDAVSGAYIITLDPVMTRI